MDERESTTASNSRWLLAFKDITASSNVRTMIAAIAPRTGCGHTLPILVPDTGAFHVQTVVCLLANLNSFSFDYVAR